MAGCASADTFDWNYTILCRLCGPYVNSQGVPVDNGGIASDLFVQAGGTFTTTNTLVNGALTITGITGSRTTNWFMGTYLNPPETDTITGLIPIDPANPYGLAPLPDNLLFPQGPNYLDGAGVVFRLNCQACGDYGFGGIVQIVEVNGLAEIGDTGLNAPSSFTVVATPEPSAFGLLGATVALAGGRFLKRRFSKRSSVRIPELPASA